MSSVQKSQRKITFWDLPLDVVIYILINQFIHKRDRSDFFQTCKYLQEWKRNNYSLELNPYFSLLYYESSDFREFVRSRTRNPYQQLHLRLDKPEKSNKIQENYIIKRREDGLSCLDVSPLSEIAYLYLKTDLNYLTEFQRVKKIFFSGDPVTLEAFQGLEELSYYRFGGGNHNYDLSVLKNLKSLSLPDEGSDFFLWGDEDTSFSRYNYRNYKELKDLQSLTLAACDDIEDVSMFHQMKSLSLNDCPNLRDIRLLKNIKTLNLSKCQNIQDFTALGSGTVESLTLSDCKNLVDVTPFALIKKVNLSGCKNIVDISPLKNVQDLNISNCSNIRDITMLCGVKTLNISDCYQIQDLTGLFQVKLLKMSSNIEFSGIFKIIKGLEDLIQVEHIQIGQMADSEYFNQTLPKLQKLKILSASQDSISLESLWNLRELRLENYKFTEFYEFGKISVLTLFGCNNLVRLSVNQLNVLRIWACEQLEEIELGILNPSKMLIDGIIYRCRSLKKIQIDCKIHRLEVSNCTRVEIFSTQQPINKLTVTQCPLLNDFLK